MFNEIASLVSFAQQSGAVMDESRGQHGFNNSQHIRKFTRQTIGDGALAGDVKGTGVMRGEPCGCDRCLDL